MPVDKRKTSIPNCVTVYPKCIVWDLCDIPCLGIKRGDTLDELTFAITTKICELSQPFDLSDISAECLIEKLGAVLPLNKTIATYLQLVIDNECKLADLVAALQESVDNLLNPTLILNLRCLESLDPGGNPIPYNVQTVLQALINEACSIRDQILNLNGEILLVNQRIDNLPAPYTEPNISIPCVYSGVRKLSQGTLLLASDYCSYKNVLGSIAEIQTAIGRQCEGLNLEFNTNINFIQDVQNQAHSVNNMWIAFCNLRNRVIALEGCACKISCDDIAVGFTTTFNDDKTVTLKFTRGAGTNIPTGFTDCGSKLSIKNDNGIVSPLYDVLIVEDTDSVDFDISMFESGEYLTFNLEVKMCSIALNCTKCVSKVVRNTNGCCLITNNGTERLTIVYKTCGLQTGGGN